MRFIRMMLCSPFIFSGFILVAIGVVIAGRNIGDEISSSLDRFRRHD